jgi:16S rRNA processing protein RimM
VAADPEFIAVGRITRAHGVHGEVAVLPLSQVETRFEPGSRLLAGPEHRRITVASERPHGNRLLVAFEEIADRTQAEALAGAYLFVPAAEVAPPPPGEFWPHQLVGSRVRTEGGRDLGRVAEVVHGPANDLWVARTDDGAEVLIPALKDVVLEVDVAGRNVLVAEVPGVTVPEASDDADG